jgi:hypothetical protein
MKRQLLFLVLAGSLALMAAPNANAAAPVKPPGYCGNNYAMLMTGAEGNTLPATGSAADGNPGALTAIVGLGVIQFSSDCSTISGELIYNDGDVQFAETGVGVFAGPAQCYAGETIFSQGMPCFDGGNHFTAASVTTAGQPPGLTLLQFTANFNAFDLGAGSSPTGSTPFAFTFQETTDDITLVGITTPSPTAPVLTLTMKQQSSSPVPTTFGKAPYVNNSAIICTGYGANGADIIAAIANSQSGGVAGSYGTAVGSVNILANGTASGLLSFNANDNLQVAGATAPPSNNSDCAFTEIPDPFDGPATFADGTSNIFSSISSPNPDPTCTNSAQPQGGFATSQVAWGDGNLNSYATVTALHVSPFGFVPPAEMSTCTHIFDGSKANGNQNNPGHQ